MPELKLHHDQAQVYIDEALDCLDASQEETVNVLYAIAHSLLGITSWLLEREKKDEESRVQSPG
jgi:triacylglycerol esterase/lipase EstA (alpha/beta hydrolase family)